MFISNRWGGDVSDRYITEHCGFLDIVKPGDEVMADKGFYKRFTVRKKGYIEYTTIYQSVHGGKVNISLHMMF